MARAAFRERAADPERPPPIRARCALLHIPLLAAQRYGREKFLALPRRTLEVEVSVLIPVLDEAATILDLAEQVAAVLDRLGRSLEIIFIDDGSGDGTAEQVRAAHERDP